MLQVLALAMITGADGNITTLTGLLVPQDAVPEVFAGEAPHDTVKTYLTIIE